MLAICLTIDYEIYLGKNYLPPEEVLFKPTQKLLEVFREHDVRSTFFPDICSAWRHRELGIPGYADEFERQLKQIFDEGHDVQLHIHPEWRFAEYKNEAWFFKEKTHALHDLGFSEDDPQGAPALIRKGKQYLEKLLGEIDPQYGCIAFRAGGWLIQPEKELISALLSQGIRIDTTVTPGLRMLRTDYNVDFRRVPDKPNWYMAPDKGISEDSGARSGLLEIPIGTYRGRFHEWHHALNQWRLRRRSKRTTQIIRGYPYVKIPRKESLVKRLRNKRRKLACPRIFDIADAHESMLKTLDSYLKRYNCRDEDFAVCMSGHSKDTYDYHLAELKRFLSTVKGKYRGLVDFMTISEYYNSKSSSSG